MAPSELSTRLSSLEEEATKLNGVSNSATDILNTVEKRLARMNIRLEVWLDSWPLKKTDPRFIDDDEESVKVHWIQKALGYARTEKKWWLGVKTVQMNGPEEEHEEPIEVCIDGDPIPLAQASRTIRLSAIRLLPRFLERLERETEQTREAIEQATRIVE